MTVAVEVLEQLAEATWQRLTLSHLLNCPISEGTLTDINLLDLKRRSPPGLIVYKARGRDEPKKGFDWEWYIGSHGLGWWRCSVQAKKLDKTNRYRHFRHKVGGKFQIDILEDFAIQNGTIPLYCFYSSSEEVMQSHWHCSLPFVREQLGCTIAPIEVAKRLHEPRKRRSFASVHSDPRVLPWRCLVRCMKRNSVQPQGGSNGGHAVFPDVFFPKAQRPRPRPLRQLPSFLSTVAPLQGEVELPGSLYRGQLGGFPRWIVVVDIEA